MLTRITTSQFTERLIYLMLADGRYRKYLSRLHERLGEAHIDDLEVFVEPPTVGPCIWARLPRIEDFVAHSATASCWSGRNLRRHLQRSPWMRSNVTVCEDIRVQRWLHRQLANKDG